MYCRLAPIAPRTRIPRGGEAGRRLEGLLRPAVARGDLTAAVALVGGPRRIEAAAATGLRRGPTLPLRMSDAFDLASLSKPWTATLALRLDALELLPLALELGEVWPQAPPALRRRTAGDLLRHRAGLAPWAPLYRLAARRGRPNRAALDRVLLDERRLGARRGTYSDLGFILWGRTAERALGAPLHQLLERHLLASLGLALRPTRPGADRAVVECRLGNDREVELAAAGGVRVARRGGPRPGEPQDGNARFLGGAPGHAGLFAPAAALWALARAWLRPGGLLGRRAVDEALAGGGRYALGWARPRGGFGGLGRGAFGHSGFTGSAVWIDPERDRIRLLLAHRSRVGFDLKPLVRDLLRRA